VLQLIHIYSVPTNEVVALSVAKPVTEGQASPVSLMVQSVLHIDRSDQEVLTPTGTVIDLSADLSQYCLSQVSVSVYICFLI